jgi:NodT family efflux transporter outer membrane factor (OMF) lipoprotein
LVTIVEEALERNQDLRASAAVVQAAVARARIAGASLKPSISAGLDGSRRQQIFVGLPIPGTSGALASTSTSWNASLNISWEADLWGRLGAGKAAATSDVAAAAEDFQFSRHSIAAQSAKAWFSCIEAEEQVRLAAATAASRTKSSQRLNARYSHGLAAPLDLRSARASQAQAERSLEERKRQLDGSRRRLQILLGRYPDAALRTTGGTAPAFPHLPAPIPPGLPAEMLRRRPDLRAAEARLQAAGYRITEAQTALYPSLTLTAGTGTTSDQISDLLDGDFSIWSIAGGLLAPLFQGGRLRAGLELTEADRERRLAEYASTILRAFSEVETALAAEAFLAAEEKALATAARESAAARDLATDRYLAGLGDFLRVLDGERQAFAAESQLLTIQRLRLDQRVDLHLALGGGFEVPSRNDAANLPTTPKHIDLPTDR